MSRVIVALPSTVRALALKFDAKMEWCYIGKNVLVTAKIAAAVGKEKRFYLGDRLHNVAEELRQPFLDFVACLGKHQKNKVNWWASRFASRSPFQTDFFLLLCYKTLVENIVKECKEEKRAICIFVEDPWLFLDLKNTNKNRSSIEFFGRPWLVTKKARLLIQGIIYRVLIGGYLFLEWLLTIYYHGARRPEAARQCKRSVAILSYVEKRAFVNGRYLDPYTCGLADLLEANGIGVLRPVYIKFPLQLSKEIGRLGGVFWPLILDLPARDMFLALVQWWSPHIPEGRKSAMSVNGYFVQTLLDREWWDELSKHSFNYNLMFYRAISHFLRKGWCQSLVYIYENQPWEKLLCIAAGEVNNVKIIGYQHSTMPRFLLSQFLGKGEVDIMPLPDKILTTGKHLLERYREGGIPTDKLSIGGVWRYEYLWARKNKSRNKDDKDTNFNGLKRTILIALPVDLTLAKALLLFISNGLPKGYREKGIELLVKPHPDTSLSVMDVEDSLLKDFNIVNDTVESLLKNVDVVIYTGSGVGLEALMYGNIKVIRYVPENMIDMDRIDWVPQDLVLTLRDGDILKLSFLEGEPPKSCGEELNKLCQRYFSKVKEQAWLEELGAI